LYADQAVELGGMFESNVHPPLPSRGTKSKKICCYDPGVTYLRFIRAARVDTMLPSYSSKRLTGTVDAKACPGGFSMLASLRAQSL
jgi:hypothetical protein